MNKKQAGRMVGWMGAVLTVAYLVGLVWLLEGRLASLKAMPLNEVGDFLAGAFGPLAILWLVLGFFQQGIELRQNSAALDLQAEELRNSVEQQSELARVAREQLESDRQALEEGRRRHDREQQERWARSQPLFQFASGGSHNGTTSEHRTAVINAGTTCSNVEIAALGIDAQFKPKRFAVLEQGGRDFLNLTLPNRPTFSAFDVAIGFRDALGEQRQQLFRCTLEFRDGQHYATLVFSPTATLSPPTPTANAEG